MITFICFLFVTLILNILKMIVIVQFKVSLELS